MNTRLKGPGSKNGTYFKNYDWHCKIIQLFYDLALSNLMSLISIFL